MLNCLMLLHHHVNAPFGREVVEARGSSGLVFLLETMNKALGATCAWHSVATRWLLSRCE